MRRLVAASFVAALAGMAIAPSARAGSVVLPRSGQVGIGVQGEYGSLLNSGNLGNEFGSGPGVVVSLRYRMRYERAIGLRFDTQLLDARSPGKGQGAFLALTEPGDTLLTRDQLKMVTAGFEIYQMFDTRSKTTKMLSAGIGIVQLSAKLSDGEVQYPIAADGLYLSTGAGLESFFYRSWAYDLGVRYQAVFHDTKVNHDVQLSLGLIFYAAY